MQSPPSLPPSIKRKTILLFLAKGPVQGKTSKTKTNQQTNFQTITALFSSNPPEKLVPCLTAPPKAKWVGSEGGVTWSWESGRYSRV